MAETLSIIIPVYNEKENIAELFASVKQAIDKLPTKTDVLFVNDGSDDGSQEEIEKVTRTDKRFKAITHAKNYGQTAAIASGISFAEGEIITLLDADLQNNAGDIGKLLEKMSEGYDVVSGWRKDRKDSYFTRILPSKAANWMISFFTGVKLHDYGCTLKAYKKEFLKNLSIYGEMHRFLPAYCAWQGARITEVAVNHHPRKFGKSKYGLGRIYKVLLDLMVVKFILSYLTKPIYVFGSIVIPSFLAGILAFLFVVARKIFFEGEWLSPMFFISVLLICLSVICLFLGLIAEVLSRLYFESRQFPLYRISKKINF